VAGSVTSSIQESAPFKASGSTSSLASRAEASAKTIQPVTEVSLSPIGGTS
jgi:hypothetical protein